MKLSNNSPFLASTVLMSIIGAYVTADKGGGINLFKASETHSEFWINCTTPGLVWWPGIYRYT